MNLKFSRIIPFSVLLIFFGFSQVSEAFNYANPIIINIETDELVANKGGGNKGGGNKGGGNKGGGKKGGGKKSGGKKGGGEKGGGEKLNSEEKKGLESSNKVKANKEEMKNSAKERYKKWKENRKSKKSNVDVESN